MTKAPPSQITILLVEDNEGDIELTRVAFEDAGVPVDIFIARDGLEALDYLAQRGAFALAVPPDLILLDINMPRMNGLDFLSAIKKDERLRLTPVVMLTSSSAQADVCESYRRYANSYVLKPSGIKEGINVARQVAGFWLNLATLPSAGSKEPS